MLDLSKAMTAEGLRRAGNSLQLGVPTPAQSPQIGAAVAGVRSSMTQPVSRASHNTDSELLEILFGLPNTSGDPLAFALQWLEGTAILSNAMAGSEVASGRELANKLRAYRDFRQAATRPELMQGGAPLEIRIGKALELGPFHGLWTLEGLGFALSERSWSRSPRPRSLFRDPAPPLRARIPLHTGMGLSLVRRVFDVGQATNKQELIETLEKFACVCDQQASPGCELMAFEALGLFVRQLHPQNLNSVDQALAEICPTLRQCFWHGVGRALFFTPSRLIAGTGRALSEAHMLPPDRVARRNALAGLSWATALVNIRHPWVLAHLLRHHSVEVFDIPAFSHGVCSALLVWRTSHGENGYLRNFLDYRPEPALQERWHHWIVEPAEDALALWADLEHEGALASLFLCPSGAIPFALKRHSPQQTGALIGLSGLGRHLDARLSRWVDTLSQSAADGAHPSTGCMPGDFHVF